MGLSEIEVPEEAQAAQETPATPVQVMSKTKRKNFVFPADITEWAEKYARDNNTTLTRIILDHLTSLRRQVESGHVEQV